jgi:hypothetical protein
MRRFEPACRTPKRLRNIVTYRGARSAAYEATDVNDGSPILAGNLQEPWLRLRYTSDPPCCSSRHADAEPLNTGKQLPGCGVAVVIVLKEIKLRAPQVRPMMLSPFNMKIISP